jgi:C4-dicarboxylate-specific signal transduction histidine kinase
LTGKTFHLDPGQSFLLKMQKRERVVCEDVRHDPVFSSLLEDLVAYSGNLARVDIPVEEDEGRLSMVSLTHREPQSWDPSTVDLLTEVSELICLMLRETRTQEKLAFTQAQIVSNAKFVALGEMASGIAHEINNPLAVIHGTAVHLQERLRSGNLDVPLFQESMASVEKMANRISTVVKGLRTFSRQSAGDPLSRVNVNTIVEEAITMCGARFRASKIQLDVRLCEDPVMIRCRSSEISQVILNLLSNAFDAVHLAPTRWVRVVVAKQDDKMQLAVADSGPAIPSDLRDRIFQPFFTTKEVGKGTGLGLSISKGIAEAHEGRLFLDHESDCTRFVLEIPLEK